jgi:aspartyl/asparaginyl beta-hydroxylase (cupin superfamily)
MQKRPLFRRAVRRVMMPVRRFRNRVCYHCARGEKRPVFHDVEKTRPELRTIDENFEVIQAEMNAILSDRGRFPRYHEADASQKAISGNDDKDWRVFMLLVAYPTIALSNAERCPQTVAILRKIPGITFAFFSILDPGKSIPAHEGPSFANLRYHTALKIPREKPPSIRVKDQNYTWKEGESVLFDDSWEHEVYNEADDVRVVLIVDVIRPVIWPVRVFSWVVLKVSSLAMSSREWASFDEKVRVREA